MQFNQEHPRLDHRGSVGSRAQSLILKTLVFVGAGVMLVSAIAVSLVFFAVALTAFFLFGVYFWWRTRDIRKQMRFQMRSRFEEGDVIEGVVVREVDVSRTEKR